MATGPDHRRVFASLRNPLALVSMYEGAPRLSATTAGFREVLGIGQEHAGRPILPLLPADWRTSVYTAVQACMSARRSKRIRGLLHVAARDGDEYELDVYRIGDEALRGHLLFSLQHLDQSKLLGDPRVSSLFPQLKTNNPVVIYENDIKYGRARYLDNGLLARFGLDGSASVTIDRILARIHPQDMPLVTRYFDARSRLGDNEVITTTIRMRAVTGEWRLVTYRARVLRRDRSGAPRRMLGVMMDVTDYNAMTEALGETTAALAGAEEEERRRIGRELHDSTAQHLLAIAFGVERLERAAPQTEAVKAAADEVRAAIEAAGREIRMFSFLLHPPELSEEGLDSALAKFCRAFGRRTTLTVQCDSFGEAVPVSDELGLAFYRIAQEALMNAFRHARATAVQVALTWLPGELVLEIGDDGPGLQGAAATIGPNLDGVGLQGMRARITRVGGTLELDAAHGGLKVVARAPLALAAPLLSTPGLPL